MNIQPKQQARKLIQSKCVAVDKIGAKAVTQIAAALFFALVLTGAAALMHLMVRDYWQEIMAALRGEVLVRRSTRPWTPRGRPSARPRPVVVRSVPIQQRAAS